jgi:nicotinate-nucleotide adenylyltransferase
MGRIAIFGGSFDPVHWGHLRLAQAALNQLRLERVLWVIDRHPPHKQVCPYEHRRAMVECAIADRPAFILATTGVPSGGIDYAIDTFNTLRPTDPNGEWFWIIGSDAFATLPRWYHRETLVPACHWLVAPRPAAENSSSSKLNDEASPTSVTSVCDRAVQQLAAQNIPIRWQLLHVVPPVAISSSLIRQSCHQGRSIRHLVPEPVRTYIARHNLYSEAVNN